MLELSSYQIDLTHSLDCDVAVLLNVTPDHLDRYDGFDDYAASKARLFAMQSPDACRRSIAIGDDDHAGAIAAAELVGAARSLTQIVGRRMQDQSRWPALQGPHNAQNAAAAIAVSRGAGHRRRGRSTSGLDTYPGLPHRMERVAEKDGVLFVNDSKATNPTSTAPALAAYPRDPLDPRRAAPRRDDLDACAPHLGHVARRLHDRRGRADVRATARGRIVPVERMRDADEAVQRAADAARPGEVGAAVAGLRVVRPVQGLRGAGRRVPRGGGGAGMSDGGSGSAQDAGGRREARLGRSRPQRARPLVLGDRPRAAAARRWC